MRSSQCCPETYVKKLRAKAQTKFDEPSTEAEYKYQHIFQLQKVPVNEIELRFTMLHRNTCSSV